MSEALDYLIRKGAYYYRWNCEGYTSDPALAGRYTLEQAEKYTHPNGPDGPRDGLSYIKVSDVPQLAPDPRIATLEAQLAEAGENIRQNLVELERINHTKATDFNMVRQLIVDNRATLSKIGGGDGNG